MCIYLCLKALTGETFNLALAEFRSPLAFVARAFIVGLCDGGDRIAGARVLRFVLHLHGHAFRRPGCACRAHRHRHQATNRHIDKDAWRFSSRAS